MKDIIEKLRNIFQSGEHEIKQRMDSNETIKWIPLLLCWPPDKYIGIAENGCWVVEELSGVRLLDAPSAYLRIKVLLERPLDDIKTEINKTLNVYDLNNLDFPYNDIISQVIANDSDYWVERAFAWYDTISVEEKRAFTEILEKAQNRKSLSQKLRHKAKKELALLKRAEA